MLGRQGGWVGIAQDNRQFINAVFWIMRTAPWVDLPSGYGGWSNTHRRFIRWRDNGVWEKLLEILIDEPDFEWLMIDASHCKVHPHAAGAKGGNQALSRTKGGSTQNCIGRGCAWYAGPGLITQGTTADFTQAVALIDGLSAGFLLADSDMTLPL